MRVNVQGGTNAGCKRPLAEMPKDPWTCSSCGRVNQPFIVRCLTTSCNQARPQ